MAGSALAIIRAAQLEGLDVPSDLAVVGVDDLPQARLSVPALSTVAPRPDKMGQFVAQRLMDGIAGRPVEPFDPGSTFIRLIGRESV